MGRGAARRRPDVLAELPGRREALERQRGRAAERARPLPREMTVRFAAARPGHPGVHPVPWPTASPRPPPYASAPLRPYAPTP
ncbi:hypothetical protein [Streptomyces sp. NPDC048650]|uniref:hypothetical protein n=1 Tax=Streptomyces sp. NPDC048650 TaxID=3365583 RepID=UPI003717C940